MKINSQPKCFHYLKIENKLAELNKSNGREKIN